MKGKIILLTIIAFIYSISLVSSAGVVNYKFTDLDSTPINLLWCGYGKDTIVILTEKNSLYRSDDKGFSFRKLNDVLMHTGKQELEENDNEIGKVSRIMESPVDSSLLIFLGTHGINWIGEDCGRKVKALNHGRKIQEYVFHPTERNWGLASAFTLCEDFQNEPCKIYKEIFVTKDMGETWELLGSYVVQFGWGVIDQSHIDAGIPKERILVTLEPRGKGNQKSAGWSYKVDFIYSDDFFKTKRIAIHKGNKFLLTKHYLFVAQVVDQELQDVMLYVTNSNDKYYNLQPIETNSKKFREHSYIFLDTSQYSVFLNINHFGSSSRYGHLYTSNALGQSYSLSLKYNIRSKEDHRSDFQKLESIEGSYIANVIDGEYMKDAEQEMEAEIMSSESMGESSAKRTEKEENHRDFIQTLITFNMGGHWNRLKAPVRDIEGKKYECEDNCYLNLHGLTGDFPTFYSVESAAGILIGNGNVGKYLSHSESDISTYLSRDGGLTWFEVRKGSHIYEIGDHGALIVIADDQNPTDTVLYTWDEGLTWQELKFSNEKIMVKNIIIEPSSISQHFVIYGESKKKGDKKGFAVGLDFSSLHEPQCKNSESPDTAESDYETWSPNDGRSGHECLMGKKIILIRRKREAECYNGLTFERKVEAKHCDCTDEDYECDAGFSRLSINDPCTKYNYKDTDTQIYEPPANCSGYYYISKGYRKIPGNVCANGVKFDPIQIPCPNKLLLSLGKIFLYIIVLGTLLVVLYLFFSKSFWDNVKEFVNNKIESSPKNPREYYSIDCDGTDNNIFDDDKDDNILVVDTEKTKTEKPKKKENKKVADLEPLEDKHDLLNLDMIN